MRKLSIKSGFFRSTNVCIYSTLYSLHLIYNLNNIERTTFGLWKEFWYPRVQFTVIICTRPATIILNTILCWVLSNRVCCSVYVVLNISGHFISYIKIWRYPWPILLNWWRVIPFRPLAESHSILCHESDKTITLSSIVIFKHKWTPNWQIYNIRTTFYRSKTCNNRPKNDFHS